MLPAVLILASMAPSVPTATTAAPRIDLISIGVGAEMYATFGHAAIRVVHPGGPDLAYNFGGVDDKQPNFWTRVVQGRLQTYLEVTSYTDLLLKYSGEDRTIVGRTLQFTPQQTQKLVHRLEQIRNSEARTYKYHYIFNNCSTKIAEVFDEALDGALSEQATASTGTHRTWILPHIHDKPTLYLAMDLFGNGMGDQPISAWQRQYIPEGFDAVIDTARVDNQAFVLSRYVDYTSMSFESPVIWDWPWNKVYMLFVFPLLLLGLAWPRSVAFIWGTTCALLGLALFGLWMASDYAFFHRNWNLLLLPPTHLWLVWAALKPQRWAAKTTGYYLLAHALIVAGLGLAHFVSPPQALGPMLGVAVPLSFALAWWQRRAPAC